MEDKKEQTKDLLAISLKELMMKVPFEKITIKMITDGAGVIRPTFYKHYQDKYEVLEWIFKKDIGDKVEVLMENDMEDSIILLLCTCLEKDRAFYKKAYLIEDQHFFDRLMLTFLYNLFIRLLDKYPFKAPAKLKILSKESVAKFYTFSLADSLKYWLVQESAYSAKDFYDAYSYIIRTSFLELMDFSRKK